MLFYFLFKILILKTVSIIRNKIKIKKKFDFSMVVESVLLSMGLASIKAVIVWIVVANIKVMPVLSKFFWAIFKTKNKLIAEKIKKKQV